MPSRPRLRVGIFFFVLSVYDDVYMSFIIINFFKSSAFTYEWFDALLLLGFFSKLVISYDLCGINSFKFFANLGVNILGVLFCDYLSNMLFELLKYLNESYLM